MRNRRSPSFTAWLSTTCSSTIRPDTSGTTLMTSAITVASSVCGCRRTRPTTTTASNTAPATIPTLSNRPTTRRFMARSLASAREQHQPADEDEERRQAGEHQRGGRQIRGDPGGDEHPPHDQRQHEPGDDGDQPRREERPQDVHGRRERAARRRERAHAHEPRGRSAQPPPLCSTRLGTHPGPLLVPRQVRLIVESRAESIARGESIVALERQPGSLLSERRHPLSSVQAGNETRVATLRLDDHRCQLLGPSVRVAWISFARSTSTLLFNTAPPSPRIVRRITSMSPSSSSTNRADVPGFIIVSTSRTKSSLIPTPAAVALPAPPNTAPMAAPASGAATTRPARKPTALQPRMLATVGNGSRSTVNVPSGCRTTTATSESRR